jgi:competence protein ComFC
MRHAPVPSSSEPHAGGPSLRSVLDSAVDLFLPRRCVHCGRPGAWLCPACRDELTPLDGPHCVRCGRPTAMPTLHCLECEGRGLGFTTAAAAFAYDGPARELVAACKFRALRSLPAEMAALAAPRLGELLLAADGRRRPDALTWVPTTRERRAERGFDQAELFARDLARRVDLRAARLLERSGGAARQHSLGRAARAANVAGAFSARPQELAGLGRAGGRRGRSLAPAASHTSPRAIETGLKRVIIVDDVYTTGETLNQCALALGGAGYEVHVFTFARTVRGHRC